MHSKKTRYFLVAIFSIFVGSQITEGALFVPYWQSLSAEAFYSFYNDFGPGIGRFYTTLTIIAALIPIALMAYFFKTNSSGKWYAVVSSLLAIIFIMFFYVYFKETNELFYQASLSESELKDVLHTWSQVHWSRVGIELLSLMFLILSLADDDKDNSGRVNNEK